MFGAPDSQADLDLEEGRPSRLKALFTRNEEDDALPFSTDPAMIFLLDERVSPRPLRLRDRPLQLAMVISLLLHLLILSQLPTGSLVQTFLAAHAAVHKKLPNDNTPFFELVKLPRQREETPRRERVAMSDLNRRAHGGVGAPSDRPASKGNTEELRLAPGPAGPAPESRPPSPAHERVAQAGRPGQEGGRQVNPGTPSRAGDTGEAAVLAVPQQRGGGTQGAPGLKGLTAYGGPGALGGAAPNREGGQVDLGDLSFDTDWYEWGPYAAEMLSRIRYHWQIPEIAQVGVPGVVRIRFFIERDGRVTGLQVLSESGHPPMDFAARDAILLASPLPPLPEDLVGVQHEGVTIAFYYNTPLRR
ncbi:MAG: TonB family protein [Thermoanaerobaculales bacterium]